MLTGIFGGTFDPIHLGHLRPALEVRESLGLDEVRFVPLAGAVHRPPPKAPPERRWAWVRAAVAPQPGFVADDLELRRGGASYTFDTLRDLRARHPRKTFCLLLGADAMAGFLDWHRPLEILELAHLVVMGRPGGLEVGPEVLRLQRERAGSPEDLRRERAGRILEVPVTQLAISATDIRARLAAGRSIRWLVTDEVEVGIRAWGGYR